MIKLEKAEHKFQRCNSCHAKNVKAITMQPEHSNHSQTFHLCDSCLDGLATMIEDAQIFGEPLKRQWSIKPEKI